MNGPAAFPAGKVEGKRFGRRVQDALVLLAQIPEAETQMMSQGWQIKFQASRYFLWLRGDFYKTTPGPKRGRSYYLDDGRPVTTDPVLAPKFGKPWIGQM